MRLLVLFQLFTVLGLEAVCAGDAPPPPKKEWSFQGPTGTFDRSALQRGFQVYKEVCSACHGLKRVAFRNLAALGYKEGQIKAIASQYQITDGPNDEGKMFERKGKPSDRIPSPYANDKMARASNNGALPPDLSLMTKARKDGSNYLYALLTGYTAPPKGMTVSEGMHYNAYYPGHQIAMAAPLIEGGVTYGDGTKATVSQMAYDVTTFLSWAAEPELERRKQTGYQVLLYLGVFTILMYLTMRRVWRDVK